MWMGVGEQREEGKRRDGHGGANCCERVRTLDRDEEQDDADTSDSRGTHQPPDKVDVHRSLQRTL
jgi:hypothetical protein